MSQNSVLSTTRINVKDRNSIDKQIMLADMLYDSKLDTKPSSTCSIGRYYYTEEENWKNESSITSMYDLQMQTQSNFDSIYGQLRESQTNFTKSQRTIDIHQQKLEQYKSQRKPAYIIPMSEEEKQKRKQERLNKKIEEQNNIEIQYERDIERQTQRKKLAEELVEKKLKEQSDIQSAIKERRAKEYEELQIKQQQEIKEYREQLEAQKDRNRQESICSTNEVLFDSLFDIDTQKQLLFNNQEIKQYIKQIEIPKNVKELVVLLKKNSKTDLEKIYRVFLFFHFHISLNIQEQKSGKQTSDLNPDSILKAKEGTVLAQATLFQEIILLMKFKGKIVKGIGKNHLTYILGQKYKGNETEHAWNIVILQGTSYLVDVTWGSGYVSKDNYFRKLQNFYFFTPAVQFLYNHFPTQDQNNQLLKRSRAWNLSKFTAMPLFTPYYFQNNILLYNYNTQNQISVVDKTISFKIRSENEKHHFRVILSKLKGKEVGVYEGKVYENEDQFEMEQLDIEFPAVGQYQIELLAQNISNTTQESKQNLDVEQETNKQTQINQSEWQKLCDFEITIGKGK